jgi:acetyl-CoA carboxylase carboxyl transferase subunit beta
MGWTPRFGKKKDMPGGLWIKCYGCAAMVYRKDFEAKDRVCPKCGHHLTLFGADRVRITADPGSFEELYAELKPIDRLGFVDKVPYAEKVEAAAKKTGRNEAMIIGTCTIKGFPVMLGVLDFAFLGGSMGVVVGEKVALAAEIATERKLPLILFSSSGGARMHEGALSLMQMAKTCGAIARHGDAGLFFISVLAHPTTGGVTASFASVADVTLAEPGALIGFAGPRVIQTTLRQDLPKGFQRAEFLLEKGQIDRIVHRDKMRAELARLLAYACGGDPAAVFSDGESGGERRGKA